MEESEYTAADKTRIAVEVFDARAEDYQTLFMDIAQYEAGLLQFTERIAAPQAQILDVACGPGNISRFVLAQRSHWQLLGIDLSARMIALAQINNPSGQFLQMDCKAIGQLPQQYDGIILGFCLPYLDKAEAIQLIQDAAQRLRPQGVLYLSTMEGDYARSAWQAGRKYPEQKIFMHYHEAQYLEAALLENGLEIFSIERIEIPSDHPEKTYDVVMMAGYS